MSKYIIDTNLIYLSKTPVADIPKEMLECARKCSIFLEGFLKEKDPKIVLDKNLLIYKEYRQAYESLKNSAPNVATIFCDWFFKYLQKIPQNDFIFLKTDASGNFVDYPSSQSFDKFDPSDRKFIALANAHHEHPPIVEASDCKWWGIKDDLKAIGLEVKFIDEQYIEQKYNQKMKN